MSAGYVTAAEMQEQLGGIPLERIRMVPPPGTATEEDALRVQDAEGRTCEVLDGILVEKAMGFFEAYVASKLLIALGRYLKDRDLGIAVGPDGLIRLSAGRLRAPDVAYISWNKLPGRKIPDAPVPALVPDLAVEVLSKGNTCKEMETKLDEYFAAGVRSVWIIDPQRLAARTYRARDAVEDVGAEGSLQSPELLPGFSLSLTSLFDRAGNR
ncbi:MAG: Uma2 family endonuclease [Planctomycetota bacterium]|nr:MAG: Uma2 family endonuclease [Planctomycetota bacterium]